MTAVTQHTKVGNSMRRGPPVCPKCSIILLLVLEATYFAGESHGPHLVTTAVAEDGTTANWSPAQQLSPAAAVKPYKQCSLNH
jgi:hypothetical protein